MGAGAEDAQPERPAAPRLGLTAAGGGCGVSAAGGSSQPAPSSATAHRQPSLVDVNSPAQAKVALFRSLFRGREDVYARRFENPKTGKSGYAPACANEWVRGICRRVYPLLEDETCLFLAVDFDKSGWQEDAAAFAQACRRLQEAPQADASSAYSHASSSIR